MSILSKLSELLKWIDTLQRSIDTSNQLLFDLITLLINQRIPVSIGDFKTSYSNLMHMLKDVDREIKRGKSSETAMKVDSADLQKTILQTLQDFSSNEVSKARKRTIEPTNEVHRLLATHRFNTDGNILEITKASEKV
ncbi:hypothetical protein L6452_36040 [Arctium lappa]|uniref:Uncharacterized protein n=1 Tax=Arctium lappa TaxID=4217 RepID=A0ACB8Y867_ARCLA|nr:hypothetical protein L6452_36040 [Arctium lappa]